MKASYVFVVLGMYAMSSVAQSALASFGNGFIVENRTANPEDRIASVATVHAAVEFTNASRTSLPQPGFNLDFLKDSQLPSVISQKLHYDILLDGDMSPDAPEDLPHAEDPNATSTFTDQPVKPPHPYTRIRWKAANGEALLSTGSCTRLVY
jgi:hypothetical protein